MYCRLTFSSLNGDVGHTVVQGRHIFSVGGGCALNNFDHPEELKLTFSFFAVASDSCAFVCERVDGSI